MALVRIVEVENFRSIKKLRWLPSAGINCIIAPGDSGKSSLLDAVDFCLGARRNLQVSDADFHNLKVDDPIRIAVTLGNLSDSLKNLETYGLYFRGFDPANGNVTNEPETGNETVLTLELKIESDLEPRWNLISARAAAQGMARSLNWADRERLAPTRLGHYSENNLSWRRGSILNRFSDGPADTTASAALADAARDARASFGESAKAQLQPTLTTVHEAAQELGIDVGAEVKALLDTHSVSFTGGTISLHDEDGIPLRGLGLGSTRLLVAGLQRRAAGQAQLIIVDELEYGLEPHRIMRFLDTLGAKDNAPLQVMMTTHSPVAIRELSGNQLFVLRKQTDHSINAVGVRDDIQGTIRLFPDALLATSVLVCEGASEIGLVRGLDQYRSAIGNKPIGACGVATVDGGGSNTFKRAAAFQALGYRVAVLRDSDVALSPEAQEAHDAFVAAGGPVFRWREGEALEDEMFQSLSDDAVDQLLAHAVELKEDSLIDAHIRSASAGIKTLQMIYADALVHGHSEDNRRILASAAKANKGWFKSISAMEPVGRDMIGPDLGNADADFGAVIQAVFDWTNG